MKTDKTYTSVPSKYVNFANVFSKKLTAKFLKHNGINNHTINLIESQQPFYKPIYSRKLIELEILKTYIDINLAHNFIKLSKSPANASILFVKKLNNSLWLYINYQSFYNLTIKNHYPLFLIGKSFDWLDWPKRFI